MYSISAYKCVIIQLNSHVTRVPSPSQCVKLDMTKPVALTESIVEHSCTRDMGGAGQHKKGEPDHMLQQLSQRHQHFIPHSSVLRFPLESGAAAGPALMCGRHKGLV